MTSEQSTCTKPPLQVIHDWWKQVPPPFREHIATSVLFRLTDEADPAHHYIKLFRKLLRARVMPYKQVGLALAVRAIIDYHFANHSPEACLEWCLEMVEGADPMLKKLGNAGIAWGIRRRPQWEKAYLSWKQIRNKSLSDDALAAWENSQLWGPTRLVAPV